MTMRLIAVLALALAGVSPAAAVEVLTGTLRSVAERGEIVLGYRESSVPFSFVEGKRPDVVMLAPLLLPFDWYVQDLKARYPDIAPATLEAGDPRVVMDAIIAKNVGTGLVYLTYPDTYVAGRYGLAQAGTLYRVRFP